ncbi:MAG: cation:proton antiporter, partial [Bradymonadaceae bacterium]
AANTIQEESGLVAVTLMGVILANQNLVKVGHIVEFKENLRVLLISTLFVVLAARIEFATVAQLSVWSLVFLMAVIFVIRPLAIFVATIGTELSWKSRLFVSTMAPRGIVAAAITSIFAFELADHGVPQAEQLLSETFLVITGTVAFYGLLSRSIAEWLGLIQTKDQGVVIAGSHSWSIEIGETLGSLGYEVEIIAQDASDVEAARHAGLRAQHGSAASHEVIEELDLTGFGKFMALSATDEVNLLATTEFAEAFGSENVYRLAGRSLEAEPDSEPAVARRRGRVLFDEPVTYDDMDGFFRRGGEIETVEVTDEQMFRQYRKNREEVIPMFYVRDDQLYVCSRDADFTPRADDTVICAVRNRPAG